MCLINIRLQTVGCYGYWSRQSHLLALEDGRRTVSIIGQWLCAIKRDAAPWHASVALRAVGQAVHVKVINKPGVSLAGHTRLAVMEASWLCRLHMHGTAYAMKEMKVFTTLVGGR